MRPAGPGEAGIAGPGRNGRPSSDRRRLTKSRRRGHDHPDASGVAYHEWPESPGSSTARQPTRDALRENGAPARCDRSGACLSPPRSAGPMVDVVERPAAPLRTREERAALLEPLIAQRILVIDGAMGTLIQSYQLDEAGFRGPDERFRNHPRDLRGDNDLLSLTQP